MSEQTARGTVAGRSILWGILLIIFGTLAVVWPLRAAVAVSALIAWLIVFAGFDHIIYAYHTKSAGSVIWDVLVGLAYIAVGIYVVFHPMLGVASLTLLLAVLLLVEGVLEVIGYFQMRRRKGSVWFLLDGIITLLLGGLIWAHWPSSSLWAIGTLVGVSMIVSGAARVMMSRASRWPVESPA